MPWYLSRDLTPEMPKFRLFFDICVLGYLDKKYDLKKYESSLNSLWVSEKPHFFQKKMFQVFRSSRLPDI